jgi:hypothetical protein
MTFQSGTSSFGPVHADRDQSARARARVNFLGVRFMQLLAVVFCLVCWAGVFHVAVNTLKAIPHAHQVAQVEQTLSVVTGR